MFDFLFLAYVVCGYTTELPMCVTPMVRPTCATSVKSTLTVLCTHAVFICY